MPTGLIEVRGNLSVAQFWPIGGADANTICMQIADEDAPFRFRRSPDAAWKETRMFNGCVVRGAAGEFPIHAKGRMLLRLRGVDAPELHCAATAWVRGSSQNAEQHSLFRQYGARYRQPFAESAVLSLVERLCGSSTCLPCTARARADHPSEVFDCYGRMVCDLTVTIDEDEFNVNHWLLTSGWGLPSLYDGMDDDEIDQILRESSQAESAGLGVWRNLAGYVRGLDWTSRYRDQRTPPAKDAGSLLHPKLYRHLVRWSVNRRSNMTDGTFLSYLKQLDQRCIRLDERRDRGARAQEWRLSDWLAGDGRLMYGPDEILFKKRYAELFASSGQRLEGW